MLTPPAAFDISAKTHNPNAGLRGNYADMTTDFTVTQQMTDYTADEQARWLRLVTRQLALIPTRVPSVHRRRCKARHAARHS